MIFFHRKRKAKSANDSEFEACALCRKPTEIRRDTPIECRDFYVYGVGQLCPKCYHKTYCNSDK